MMNGICGKVPAPIQGVIYFWIMFYTVHRPVGAVHG